MSGGWTPGPWAVGKNGDVNSKDGLVVVVGVSYEIGKAARDRDKADARLIAAAPDLYEALEWAVNHFDGDTKCNANQETNCIEKCRDALAKARGDAS